MRLFILIGISILLSISGAQAGDWPMFGHDAAHTGTADEVVEPPLEVLWKYTIRGYGGDVLSSPSVSGGVLYVSAADGYLYALDASTGSLRRKYQTNGPTSIAVSDGVVYGSSYGYVYAYDKESNQIKVYGTLSYGYVHAIDTTTGSLKWEYKTDGYIGPPTISGEIVYIPGYYLYALDANTGDLRWEYKTNYNYSSIAVSEDTVYVSSYYMYALDANTGSLKWVSQHVSGATASPSVYRDIVYVSSHDGYVYALDANTGDIKWNYKIGSTVSSPAVSGGVVYVGSSDFNVYALDARTGSLKWKYMTDGGVRSSPAISGGVVYVGSMDHNLYALDAITGSLKWKYKTSDYVKSSPAISDGVVYVDSGSTLYAFAPKQTNWALIGTILTTFLVGIVALLLLKQKKEIYQKISPLITKSSIAITIAIGLGLALILFLSWYSQSVKDISTFIDSVIIIMIIFLILPSLAWVSRNFSIKMSVLAIGLISVFLVFVTLMLRSLLYGAYSAIIFGIIEGLALGLVWIIIRIIVQVILFSAKTIRNRNFNTVIGSKFRKPIKSQVAMKLKVEEIRQKSEYKNVQSQKYKIAGIILIILLIIVGAFGYMVYQKYSPLSELAKCENCIDYKKVNIVQYEASVPDIKITGVDVEKLIIDVPIIIHNPSTKDTETVKIDFDIYMEGRHLTQGTIPAYELPAKQNTTILIKDVAIKYEELGEVLQIVGEKHGTEIVREGKANIMMTIDLVIYFPIEIFDINIYTFSIPVTIETEVPIDMLNQKEGAEKQIDEKLEELASTLTIEPSLPVSEPSIPKPTTAVPTIPEPTIPSNPL